MLSITYGFMRSASHYILFSFLFYKHPSSFGIGFVVVELLVVLLQECVASFSALDFFYGEEPEEHGGGE